MIKVDVKGVSMVHCTDCGFNMTFQGIVADGFMNLKQGLEVMAAFNKGHLESNPKCPFFEKEKDNVTPITEPEKKAKKKASRRKKVAKGPKDAA